MRSADLMTPDHPRWGQFIDQLARSTRCDRTTDHARRVLESMGVDVTASLIALRELGGYCDCSILFDLVELEGAG